MNNLCRISLESVQRLVCLCVLVVVLAGHVSTLALAYAAGQDDGNFGKQLLLGGLSLCSVVPLMGLSWLLPGKAGFLRRVWLAAHLTWRDDLARHAVLVLYNLQVKPVLDALGLAFLVAELNTLDYWWWSLQGLLLMVLSSRVSGSGYEDECELDTHYEDTQEPQEVIVVVGGRQLEAIQVPTITQLPDHPAPAHCFVEIEL